MGPQFLPDARASRRILSSAALQIAALLAPVELPTSTGYGFDARLWEDIKPVVSFGMMAILVKCGMYGEMECLECAGLKSIDCGERNQASIPSRDGRCENEGWGIKQVPECKNTNAKLSGGENGLKETRKVRKEIHKEKKKGRLLLMM